MGPHERRLLASEDGHRPIAVFDGHNDSLLALHLAKASEQGFIAGTANQLDLPRARDGGFAGGLFALFVPPRADAPDPSRADMQPVCHQVASAVAMALAARAIRLEGHSAGAIEVVRDVTALDRCRWDGHLAIVLHMEGAEPIDLDLDALEVWYAAGLRSLGPVWSRPNGFGHGVPLRHRGSPNIGPGLTEAGLRLVRRCNELGILLDVAHLNEAGFWDVARVTDAPFVASHSAAHALCGSSRNLTDGQLRAIADAGGLVGITFATNLITRGGRADPDTPLSTIVHHLSYVADLIGVDHVALGSDFDGATTPRDAADASALPTVLAAISGAGFDHGELDQIAWGNWRRVLGAAWRGSSSSLNHTSPQAPMAQR
jgi:membrane dipeptidase